MPNNELHLTMSQLKALVNPVLPLAGKDPMLPVLCCVRIETRGPWLLAMATDRFRLGAKRMAAPEGESWPTNWSATIPTRTLRKIIATFKPGFRDADPQLTLTVDGGGDELLVEAGGALLDVLGASVTYPLESGEFPNLHTLLGQELGRDVQPGAHAGFDWAFLADFRHAQATNAALHMRISSARHPAIITDGGDFIGMLMPRRVVSDDTDAVEFPKLADWIELLAKPKPPTRKRPAAKKAAAKKPAAKRTRVKAGASA